MAAPQAVLDFLDGMALDPLPIVGNSMGGNVAARIAASHPDRVSRLVTIGGVGLALFSPMPAEGIKLLVQFVEDPTRERLVAWMESMVYDPAILTEEFVELRWEAANAPGGAGGRRRMFNAKILKAMRRRNPMVGEQVGHAGEDRGADADHVRPRRPGHAARQRARADARSSRKCEVHIFPNCGHWAMIERKDEFERRRPVVPPPRLTSRPTA